jgi:1,4-dihydroxy-2-naphthoate octaprenyltransferase
MTSLSTPAPRPIGLWLSAIRPTTLWASLIPVLIGSALATFHQHFVFVPALLALLGAVFIQIGTNLSNDLFDHLKGADTPDRVGPARASSQGWFTIRQMAWATAVAFLLSALCGIGLALHSGWPVIAIGAISVLSGLAYTAGPYPLAYLGLGDIFVIAFFGPVAVLGTYYVQAGSIPESVYLASIPPGLLITMILVVNNLRDRHTDAKVNKKTLAVRFGAKAARIEYTLLAIASYMILGISIAQGNLPMEASLSFISAPLAIWECYKIWTSDGPDLNPCLGRTARLGLLYAILFTIGLGL